ncbi:MAG TPA: anaerobic ribonucleoside-triphosphate reductase [bacterium]|nr:anaerobic ribonucleoside-triphosphate reductase [bacterium]
MQTREQKAARLAELKASLLCVEGTPTEVYSRIVGYYRSVRNWNAGKREEFKARAGYSFPVATDQRPAELSSYVLFTRQTCPNCPAVKEFLAASGLPGILIDVDTETGLDAARRYEVLSTPTAIMLGEDGEERCRAYSKSQAAALLVQSQTQETTHPTAALQTA